MYFVHIKLCVNYNFVNYLLYIQVRTRAVACKQMTMVTPIHLLLFGARKIEYTNGFVQLDNW